MLRQIVARVPRLARNVSYTSIRMAATNLDMPAMSPTMTEGGIVEWKFKEGDSFSAGDVLLEVETDKAQIDVEAQDDGILAKIYAQAGEKGIPVGKSIAVVAEPGDDISSLEMPTPAEGSQTVEEAAAPQAATTPAANNTASVSAEKEAPKKENVAAKSANSTQANPDQTLLPSVSTLLHQNSIAESQALANIPATGPNGRLLKGDVLAYLGTVSQESLNAVEAQIKKLSQLDLSNIKLRQQQQPEAAKQPGDEKKKDDVASRSGPVAIERQFGLQDLELLSTTVDATMSSSVTSSTVEQLVEKASKLAVRDVCVLNKPRASPLYDPIFEQLIAAPKGTKTFDISLTYTKNSSSAPTKSEDIYSILTSSRKPLKPVQRSLGTMSGLKVSVIPNPKVSDSKRKADAYLDRLGYYLSEANGDLVL